MRFPLALGYAAGSALTAILVLADLGVEDVLFVPALALLAPGAIAAGVVIARLVRGEPSSPVEDDDRVVGAMRNAAPIRVAAGVLLGITTTACLGGAALVAMFGGGGH